MTTGIGRFNVIPCCKIVGPRNWNLSIICLWPNILQNFIETLGNIRDITWYSSSITTKSLFGLMWFTFQIPLAFWNLGARFQTGSIKAVFKNACSLMVSWGVILPYMIIIYILIYIYNHIYIDIYIIIYILIYWYMGLSGDMNCERLLSKQYSWNAVADFERCSNHTWKTWVSSKCNQRGQWNVGSLNFTSWKL